jgi:N-acetylmuramoyl-L-alanine amidase
VGFTVKYSALPNLFHLDSITRVGRLAFVLIFIAGSISLPAGFCRAATIVLDPGHGGQDGGANGGFEVAEKHFTLLLAQEIANILSERHRVELTRTADIELAPAERAGLANHMQADLMISLHAAVAPYCSNQSAGIYVHQDKSLALPPEKMPPSGKGEPNGGRPAWERLQRRHSKQSRRTAEIFQQSMQSGGVFNKVDVRNAPLVVLMGADLPAVLLEVGCLYPAVPLTDSQLRQQVNDYAPLIAKAIEEAWEALSQ